MGYWLASTLYALEFSIVLDLFDVCEQIVVWCLAREMFKPNTFVRSLGTDECLFGTKC